jgi:hypothetical protein
MQNITPRHLFLRDTFIRDCQRSRDDESKDSSSFKEYDELPTVFRSLGEWNAETNLRCWHCDLGFSETPVFVPKTIEPKDGGVVMLTEGNFCSFPCAVTWINLQYSNLNDQIEAKGKLCYLYSLYHGESVREIAPMPPKYEMKQYGGHLTATQYREQRKQMINQ